MYYKRILLCFQLYIHLMKLYIFWAFLPPGCGFASVHADPDPGGISLCRSVRIQIRNTANLQLLIMVNKKYLDGEYKETFFSGRIFGKNPEHPNTNSKKTRSNKILDIS